MEKLRLVTVAAVSASLLIATGAAGAAEPVTTATIASSTAVGFRAVVTATKGSDGGAPSVSVEVAAFEKVNGTWKSVGRLSVGRRGGFFWKVLTGAHSIRRFSISTDSPERVTLQLLVTPSIGWSPLYSFHVEKAKLVRG